MIPPIMPIISALYFYPIKSCGAVALDEVALTARGMALDRHWMLVGPTGRFTSQREYPALARVQPRPDAYGIRVNAPGCDELFVSDDDVLHAGRRSPVSVWAAAMSAQDAGDAAARWFSDYVGTPLRLVRFDPDVTRQADVRWTQDHPAPTQFADGFPFLVTNQSSLDELNSRLQAKGAPAIPMDRFRPNIVISGLDAYEEDHIGRIMIDGVGDTAGGEITLRFVKPCARCPIPTINQATGHKDENWPHEPLDTLAGYRADPRVDGGLTFGQNAILEAGVGAILRCGANVDVEIDFPD
jgi:uncharacterized protein YcbX